MNNLKSNEASTEVKCSACNGTGFPPVAQPAHAGRRIYPPPCKLCFGLGFAALLRDKRT
jgi:DnaJ-class molecular chaperone